MSLMPTKRRELTMLAMAAAVLVLDQLTKAAVMRYLPPETPWNPIEPLRAIVTLTYVTNTGVAFGLFPQFGNVFIVLPVVIVAALLLFYRRFALSHWLLPVCLGMQLGGAVGNLIDRLRFGHVIDFVDLKFWPVFNVADSCIVVGVLILAILLLRDKPEEGTMQPGSDGH